MKFSSFQTLPVILNVWPPDEIRIGETTCISAFLFKMKLCCFSSRDELNSSRWRAFFALCGVTRGRSMYLEIKLYILLSFDKVTDLFEQSVDAFFQKVENLLNLLSFRSKSNHFLYRMIVFLIVASESSFILHIFCSDQPGKQVGCM